MVEVKTAEQIASSQYVFAILFIILLFVVAKYLANHLKEMKEENGEREKELKVLYTEHKLESKEREQVLMLHLERSNESQEKSSNTLEKIEVSLRSLEKRMDEGFANVWEHIKNK